MSSRSRRLEDREWIACDDFTAADMTDLLDPFPKTEPLYERCQARPAWQRTSRMYAERLGVSVDDIR